MIKNISDAIRLLDVYFSFLLGSQFSFLMYHAEQYKLAESLNDSNLCKYHIDEFTDILTCEFSANETTKEFLTKELAKGLDHFQYRFVKKLLDKNEITNKSKVIEDEIASISQALQRDPHNYHSGDFANGLKVGILFNLQYDLEQIKHADKWSSLVEKFDPQYLRDGPESVYDVYSDIMIEQYTSLYFGYRDEPWFPLYVLNIIYRLPYQSL